MFLYIMHHNRTFFKTNLKTGGISQPVLILYKLSSGTFCRRADKAEEKRMRLVRTALELRMKLYADEEILIGNLNGLNQAPVR